METVFNALRHMVYRSADGKVLAFDGVSADTLSPALRAATLVFFSYEEDGSFIRGVQRNLDASEPHAGELIDLLACNTGHHVMAVELWQWYLDPAGFFSGRGTAKAPCRTPMAEGVTIALIAADVDRLWQR